LRTQRCTKPMGALASCIDGTASSNRRRPIADLAPLPLRRTPLNAMLTVRKATHSDALALSKLLAELAVGHPAEGRTPGPDWVRDAMIDDPSICRVLIAERFGQSIGFAAWRPTHDDLFGARGAEVFWLFVLAGHRGLGVGAILLTHVCADALRDGATFLLGEYGRPIVGRLYERLASGEPKTSVGLPIDDVRFLAGLAGATPKKILRALRPRRR